MDKFNRRILKILMVLLEICGEVNCAVSFGDGALLLRIGLAAENVLGDFAFTLDFTDVFTPEKGGS